jgi:RNA polymerase sigma-70 factor (ECF subfamily)
MRSCLPVSPTGNGYRVFFAGKEVGLDSTCWRGPPVAPGSDGVEPYCRKSVVFTPRGRLERRHVTSAITMFIEGERAVPNGLLRERAQELDSVVSRYLPTFYKRAFRFLGNIPDAEDAVQDALLSAYKHLGQFRGQAQLSTWLTTIVTNAALMKLRRRDSYLSLDEEQGEDGLTLSERLPDSKPSPEELCFAAEARYQLVEGVRQLSPKLRRTLQLRDIDGLTTKEAALVLGVPHGTVKAQLARARAKLARSAQLKPIRGRARTVSPDKAVQRKDPRS